MKKAAFILLSMAFSAWSVQSYGTDFKNANDGTPLYMIDNGSFVIAVVSSDSINSALRDFNGYKNMSASDRLPLRSLLRTAFVEGETGPYSNVAAMGLSDTGLAVCTLNFKDDASYDSSDFVTKAGEVLNPVLGQGQQSTGLDGAIYLKDQYFYIYCQGQGSTLTLGYFKKVFNGTLSIHPAQAE